MSFSAASALEKPARVVVATARRPMAWLPGQGPPGEMALLGKSLACRRRLLARACSVGGDGHACMRACTHAPIQIRAALLLRIVLFEVALPVSVGKGGFCYHGRRAVVLGEWRIELTHGDTSHVLPPAVSTPSRDESEFPTNTRGCSPFSRHAHTHDTSPSWI
jgi:hypothetical protein